MIPPVIALVIVLATAYRSNSLLNSPLTPNHAQLSGMKIFRNIKRTYSQYPRDAIKTPFDCQAASPFSARLLNAKRAHVIGRQMAFCLKMADSRFTSLACGPYAFEHPNASQASKFR